MDLNELRENMEMIFAKERNDLKNRGYSFLTQEDSIFSYPNAEILLQLYAELIKIHDAFKSAYYTIDFVNRLIKNVEESEENSYPNETDHYSYVGTSALCFYALIKIDYANELSYKNRAIESLKKRKKGQKGCHGIYRLLYETVERMNFDATQLKELFRILKVPDYNIDRVRLLGKILELM